MSLICSNKKFIKDINQILFNFIWKGKDKVKRVTLINDINEGGLKMPHIESMIEAQRIMCIQKFLDNSSRSWKCILNHYLNKVGGRLFFICIKPHITESLLNVLDLFYLKCLYHSLPPEWKKEMSSNVTQAANKTTPFNIFAQEELSSKKIYNLLISKISKPPTAKKKLENQYASETSSLDWETIYTLPFKCALDTKSREFQYKILNQILPLLTPSFSKLAKPSLLSVRFVLATRNVCRTFSFNVP